MTISFRAAVTNHDLVLHMDAVSALVHSGPGPSWYAEHPAATSMCPKRVMWSPVASGP